MLNRYGKILAIAPILFLTNAQAGEIKGVVKSAETSQPVGGAMVIVTPGGKDPVMTDDKGAYSVSGLPDGTYTVTADYAGAKKLFDAYGIHFDPKERDEVVARVDKLNLPSYSGFVMPKLTPVTGADGKITDVAISYPLDLTTQMLEYDGVKR